MIIFVKLENNNQIKYWNYITKPKAPCPIKTGSWYRMGTVNCCPLQSKVCHSSWFVVLVAIVIFLLLEEKEMCGVWHDIENM